MHLLDANDILKKYNSPEEILEEFFHIRLEYYAKRKRQEKNNHDADNNREEAKAGMKRKAMSSEDWWEDFDDGVAAKEANFS
ncbi:hypothetical protein COLO4_28234 [Corchorus olitorius]|uniref:Uncharacterized protein n=1 Tax=Corchorus olitorius TaxID=93759 RepID=A0A1R3HMB8_9ROSI|nr:hypothetical protein COLO4_28234 [Corchorus olitorius]